MTKLTINYNPCGQNAVYLLVSDEHDAVFEPAQVVSKRDLIRARAKLIDRLCARDGVAEVHAPEIPAWAVNGAGYVWIRKEKAQ